MDGQRGNVVTERRFIIDQQCTVGDGDGASKGGVHAEKRQRAGTFHRKRTRAGHGAGQNVAGTVGRDQRQCAGRDGDRAGIRSGRRDGGGGVEGGKVVRLGGYSGRRPVGRIAP